MEQGNQKEEIKEIDEEPLRQRAMSDDGKSNQMPEEKGILFFGPVKFFKHPAIFIEEKKKLLGNVFKTTLAGHEVVIMCGNELLKYYYNEEYVTRAKPFSPIQKEIAGGGSLSVSPFFDGETHRIRKKLLLRLVDKISLDGYIKMLDSMYNSIFKKWISLPEVKMFYETRILAAEVIFRIIFGLDEEYVETHAKELNEKVENFSNGLQTKVKFNIPGTTFAKAIEARSYILNIIENQFNDLEKRIKNNEDVPPCFITNFLKNVLPNIPKDHHFDQSDQIREFLHIALGTSSFGLPILYLHMELPKHPHIVSKIKAEIQSLSEEELNTPTTATLDKLIYTEQVVKEILRLYPYVTIFPATARKDFIIEEQGFKVNEGSIIIAALYSTNLDEKIYQNPNKFDPDRFSPERAEDQRAKCPHFAFVPQGGGNPDQTEHRCLGEQFVRYGVKLYLIRMMSSYECKIYQDQKLKLDWSHSVPLPIGSIKVRFYDLKDNQKREEDKLEGTIFKITIHTGNHTHAMKDSDIFITLIGNTGKTNKINLTDHKRKKVFENGHTYRYKIKVMEDLGQILFIELEKHDSRTPHDLHVKDVTLKRLSKYLMEGEDVILIPVQTFITDQQQQFEVPKN